MIGAGQSAGARLATMTFDGMRGGTDAHPLVATHAMMSHVKVSHVKVSRVKVSQENQYLGR